MIGAKTTNTQEAVYRRPWFLLGVGVVLLFAAWVVRVQGSPGDQSEASPVTNGVGFLLIVAGATITYASVVRRLSGAGWDFQSRVESAALVSISGLGAFLAYFAMPDPWTSGRMFFVAVLVLTLVGVGLILLPSLPRRVVLSLIVLFHLVGIVTAVTFIDPPNSSAPWLVRQLMLRVYQPYLRFVYMTNAYHFFSPEPGTSSIFAVAVYYSDGTYAWLKVPNKADARIGMEYQRMNCLPESTFQAMLRLPYTENELAPFPKLQPPRRSWERINDRRRTPGSTREYLSKDGNKQIPWVGDVDMSAQYQEPTDNSKMQIAAVARHFFTMPAAQREEVEVTSVKLYRVRMVPLTPYEISLGKKPGDRTKTMSYFLGEFDKDGMIVHKLDPFLYWYLRVVKVPPTFPAPKDYYNGIPYVTVNTAIPPSDWVLLDSVEMHAATPSPKELKEEK